MHLSPYTKTTILLLCIFTYMLLGLVTEDVNASPLYSMEQMEAFIYEGPERAAALAAIQKEEALLELNKQRSGAKYFGSLTYGYSNEPAYETSPDRNSYTKLSLTGGITFPLMGSSRKDTASVLEAQLALDKAKLQSESLLLNSLISLRKAYATLWVEKQEEDVIRRFLSTESTVTHILQERQAQGLLLASDQLEFLAVYFEAKRELAGSKLRQTRALRVIDIATGRSWDLAAGLKPPSLPDAQGKSINIERRPELEYQSKITSEYQRLSLVKRRIDQEANLSIGVTGTKDYPGTTGNGSYISLSVTEPMAELGKKDQGKIAADADLLQAKQEELLVRTRLEGMAQEALATAEYAAADINARAARLTSMTEAIRERTLRRTVLPGDTFEQLQHSKSQYFRLALEMLSSEEQFLHAAIDIVSCVFPKGRESEAKERVTPISETNDLRLKLLSPDWLEGTAEIKELNNSMNLSTMPSLKLPANTFEISGKVAGTRIFGKNPAVYVWDAEPLLDAAMRETTLNEISEAGFSRVLLSLNSKQIASVETGSGSQNLHALIRDAKNRGLRLDLLLGDPTWAEPDKRGHLSVIIKKLDSFEFDGLHLDIEPDSIPGIDSRRIELYKGLIDTLKEAKAITNKPISISIHPRYLEGELGLITKQQLFPIGLEDIVVMVYSTNTQAVISRMEAIMHQYPELCFALAQSVEQSGPKEESYAHFSRGDVQAAMGTIVGTLANQGLKNIYVQSWEDLKKGELR